MNEYAKVERDEQVLEESKVAYEEPEVTVMGKVEHLTALLVHGVPDALAHGNIL